MGPVLCEGSSALPGETWISVGVLALLGVLVRESAAGRSGIGALGAERGRADAAGGPGIRFFLMIAVTWVATGFESQPRLGPRPRLVRRPGARPARGQPGAADHRPGHLPRAVYLASDDPVAIEADTGRLRELERNGLYAGR